VCGGDIFGGKNALDGLLKDFVAASNTVPWLLVEGCGCRTRAARRRGAFVS